ncbi:membrane protein [Photobacterium aquae]|uniref:Membrane protein n=1 Tax=Photobacterium aquae TaxID=1195763 RepID=A0A0J1H3T3_9GAMM|nr:DUF2069 domain-containing protein [Photobacterium aquae]KLV06446.1 membrane protein [Photobacterium aquae]
MTPPHLRTRFVLIAAQAAYFCLAGWVVLWQSWLSPHPHLNAQIMAGIWVLPLLLPLRGIIAGKPYTFAWANFILMFYFLHALTLLWVDEGERWLAGVELCLVSTAFVGNALYARLRGRELGSRLKRLSQVEKEENERYRG